MKPAAKKTSKHDWGLFFGGLLCVLIGIGVMVWPNLTAVMVAQIAGAILLVAGVLDIVSYVRARKAGTSSAWSLVNAICDLILGLLFLLHPLISATVIFMMFGIVVVAYGVFAVIAGVGLRKVGPGWWLMVLNGVVAILCGIMFIMAPEMFVLFLGIFLIMRGVTMAVYGIIAPNALPYI